MFRACRYQLQSVEVTLTVVLAMIADLGVCRNPRYRLGKPFLKEYLNRIPMAEPEEDFDDRNALYALYAFYVPCVTRAELFAEIG